jgi:hypothetical protein
MNTTEFTVAVVFRIRLWGWRSRRDHGADCTALAAWDKGAADAADPDRALAVALLARIREMKPCNGFEQDAQYHLDQPAMTRKAAPLAAGLIHVILTASSVDQRARHVPLGRPGDVILTLAKLIKVFNLRSGSIYRFRTPMGLDVVARGPLRSVTDPIGTWGNLSCQVLRTEVRRTEFRTLIHTGWIWKAGVDHG